MFAQMMSRSGTSSAPMVRQRAMAPAASSTQATEEREDAEEAQAAAAGDKAGDMPPNFSKPMAMLLSDNPDTVLFGLNWLKRKFHVSSHGELDQLHTMVQRGDFSKADVEGFIEVYAPMTTQHYF